jgi:hypothetical protein
MIANEGIHYSKKITNKYPWLSPVLFVTCLASIRYYKHYAADNFHLAQTTRINSYGFFGWNHDLIEHD